uniref:Uncharacterized protein n=1 Tax=Trichuris muris TaxID=70415 RepID=A0A5S6QVB1_TRIMR
MESVFDDVLWVGSGPITAGRAILTTGLEKRDSYACPTPKRMRSQDVPCGWSVFAWLHYGHDLSDYVGVSVTIVSAERDALAKATSVLVFVGVGSYVAYRVLLGLNAVDIFHALLFYVEPLWCTAKRSEESSEHELNGSSVHSFSSEEQSTIVKVSSSSSSSVGNDGLERRTGDGNEAVFNCDLTVRSAEPNVSANLAQSLPVSCHSSPICSRQFRSCSRNSSSSFLNGSCGSRLSSTPFLWDYEWTPFSDHPLSHAKRRSTSSGLSPRKRALLSSNGLYCCSDFSSEHSQVYSRDPSEWSEMVELKQVGEGTIAEFDQLQRDIVELRSEMETFKTDCDRYVEDRQATLGDLRSMYRSVPPTSDSGSPQPDAKCLSPSSSSVNMVMMASCDSICTCRPTSVLCPSCGTHIPTSRCRGCASDVDAPSAVQGSYHSFISAGVVPSVCSSSGDVAAMGASFVDSCISSFDENCFGSFSCSSPGPVGPLPKMKSFDLEHGSPTSPMVRVLSSSATWLLVDLNNFLCKNVAHTLSLNHVTCQLIHRRALQRVFLPSGGQLNIIQAVLYYIYLQTALPLTDALTNSLNVFLNWFSRCNLPHGVLTASCIQSLAALESWLQQGKNEEAEIGTREFEAKLPLYETATKVLIAWNVLIRHSSVVSEEGIGSSHSVMCDQSESTSIFVNTLQKPAEDFSYTEIETLAKMLNVIIEVFDLTADVPRLLIRYPNVQSVYHDYDEGYSHCLPLLSVVPCNYLPVF